MDLISHLTLVRSLNQYSKPKDRDESVLNFQTDCRYERTSARDVFQVDRDAEHSGCCNAGSLSRWRSFQNCSRHSFFSQTRSHSPTHLFRRRLAQLAYERFASITSARTNLRRTVPHSHSFLSAIFVRRHLPLHLGWPSAVSRDQ